MTIFPLKFMRLIHGGEPINPHVCAPEKFFISHNGIFPPGDEQVVGAITTIVILPH